MAAGNVNSNLVLISNRCVYGVLVASQLHTLDDPQVSDDENAGDTGPELPHSRTVGREHPPHSPNLKLHLHLPSLPSQQGLIAVPISALLVLLLLHLPPVCCHLGHRRIIPFA